jgi:3-oxoacyl-[acyl-carrier-protein] synthase-1/3-oxoacyl-[acyl-carrier-protein] synthase II
VVAGAGSLEVAPDRLGIFLGTTSGCTFNDEDFFMQFRAGGEPDIAPFGQYLDNDVARVVADYVGARGPVVTVANACASGTDAIGCGAAWLRSGVCDLVVAGGADELCRFPYLGFISLQNTSPERCRPFDLHRKGLNLGEGAAIVILEREEDARRRGARILARLSGYASASDAYHPTSPHPEGRGLRKAMHLALRAAGLEATEIAFVNAHGTGTAENDRVEGRVLADLLSPSLRIFSTKGYTGHATGAAGAVEAVLTIRNLLDQRVPRSGGFQTADPECAVVPTTETRDVRCRAAISNSLAFGGTNSVLVFRRGDAS